VRGVVVPWRDDLCRLGGLNTFFESDRSSPGFPLKCETWPFSWIFYKSRLSDGLSKSVVAESNEDFYLKSLEEAMTNSSILRSSSYLYSA
jgi:hypothetical protein